MFRRLRFTKPFLLSYRYDKQWEELDKDGNIHIRMLTVTDDIVIDKRDIEFLTDRL